MFSECRVSSSDQFYQELFSVKVGSWMALKMTINMKLLSNLNTEVIAVLL